MTRRLSLQDFGQDPGEGHGSAQPVPTADPQPLGPAEATAIETDALEAYDSGYKNGWADCAAAEAEERQSVAADLAKNLGEARLTYEAARRDVLLALGPFFDDLTAILLPGMTAAALAPAVRAELDALAVRQAEGRVEIMASPETCASLRRLIETERLDVALRPEPALAEGQVSIRVGAERRDIDMAGAAARIAEAIAAFRHQIARSGTMPRTQFEGTS